MKNNLKQIPRFNNENEERKFWNNTDSVEYLDWSKAKRGLVFSKNAYKL